MPEESFQRPTKARSQPASPPLTKPSAAGPSSLQCTISSGRAGASPPWEERKQAGDWTAPKLATSTYCEARHKLSNAGAAVHKTKRLKRLPSFDLCGVFVGDLLRLCESFFFRVSFLRALHLPQTCAATSTSTYNPRSTSV